LELAAVPVGALLLVVLLVAGCTTPIGADHRTARIAHKQVAASALDHVLSPTAQLVLHRYTMTETYSREPAAALLKLQEKTCEDGRRDLFYGLAELNYLHAIALSRSVKPGEAPKANDYFLAAAIYSWLFLFGDALEPAPTAFDRRFRDSCDLYNRAVARAFLNGPKTNQNLVLGSQVRQVGNLQVSIGFSRTNFKWDLADVEQFLPADEYVVRGLSVRDRRWGLGAPLIVVGKTLEKKTFPRRFPATLLLRGPTDLKAWRGSSLALSLELYSTYEEEEVEIGGRKVPLEGDFSTPMAYALNDQRVWELGAQQFFSPEEKIKSNIYFTQPYAPGKIPVIFVHGTFSSPVWWAEMWNTLRADPILREKFQFWNYIYNSGNPIVYSAANLAEQIQRKVEQLDPEGKDSALRQMVIIGHSQGGLLTKLMAVETGDALWTNAFPKSFSETAFENEEQRNNYRKFAFYEPQPSVKRVVFVSTPHRGSFLATGFVRNLARKFMTIPQTAISATETALRLKEVDAMPGKIRKVVPTSLDGMSPKNPALLTLAEIPVRAPIHAHSIIAVKGDGPPERGGDGVVKYTSARQDYVESEFVVRSGHSCQDRPEVIEEVRRILLEHAKTAGPLSAAD
jgi:triacylglycerol esterase/lipase EstA (alpha/beta hydrolase family)